MFFYCFNCCAWVIYVTWVLSASSLSKSGIILPITIIMIMITMIKIIIIILISNIYTGLLVQDRNIQYIKFHDIPYSYLLHTKIYSTSLTLFQWNILCFKTHEELICSAYSNAHFLTIIMYYEKLAINDDCLIHRHIYNL